MRRLVFLLSLVGIAGCAQQSSRRPLTGSELKKVTIYDSGYTGYQPEQGGLIGFRYYVNVNNDTPLELASINVRLLAKLRNGKVIYSSEPVHLTDFPNFIGSYTGSILPWSRTYSKEDISFDVPSRDWRTDTDLVPE